MEDTDDEYARERDTCNVRDDLGDSAAATLTSDDESESAALLLEDLLPCVCVCVGGGQKQHRWHSGVRVRQPVVV